METIHTIQKYPRGKLNDFIFLLFIFRYFAVILVSIIPKTYQLTCICVYDLLYFRYGCRYITRDASLYLLSFSFHIKYSAMTLFVVLSRYNHVVASEIHLSCLVFIVAWWILVWFGSVIINVCDWFYEKCTKTLMKL